MADRPLIDQGALQSALQESVDRVNRNMPNNYGTLMINADGSAGPGVRDAETFQFIAPLTGQNYASALSAQALMARTASKSAAKGLTYSFGQLFNGLDTLADMMADAVGASRGTFFESMGGLLNDMANSDAVEINPFIEDGGGSLKLMTVTLPEAVGNLAGQMAQAGLLKGAGMSSFSSGFIPLSIQAGQSQFERALSEGKSISEARSQFIWYGLSQGFVEAVVMDRIFGRMAKAGTDDSLDYFRKYLIGRLEGATSGATESILSDWIAGSDIDWMNALQSAGVEAVAGGIIEGASRGFVMSSTGQKMIDGFNKAARTVYSPIADIRVEGKAKQVQQRIYDTQISLGATPEQAQSFTEDVTGAIEEARETDPVAALEVIQAHESRWRRVMFGGKDKKIVERAQRYAEENFDEDSLQFNSPIDERIAETEQLKDDVRQELQEKEVEDIKKVAEERLGEERVKAEESLRTNARLAAENEPSDATVRQLAEVEKNPTKKKLNKIVAQIVKFAKTKALSDEARAALEKAQRFGEEAAVDRQNATDEHKAAVREAILLVAGEPSIEAFEGLDKTGVINKEKMDEVNRRAGELMRERMNGNITNEQFRLGMAELAAETGNAQAVYDLLTGEPIGDYDQARSEVVGPARESYEENAFKLLRSTIRKAKKLIANKKLSIAAQDLVKLIDSLVSGSPVSEFDIAEARKLNSKMQAMIDGDEKGLEVGRDDSRDTPSREEYLLWSEIRKIRLAMRKRPGNGLTPQEAELLAGLVESVTDEGRGEMQALRDEEAAVRGKLSAELVKEVETSEAVEPRSPGQKVGKKPAQRGIANTLRTWTKSVGMASMKTLTSMLGDSWHLNAYRAIFIDANSQILAESQDAQDYLMAVAIQLRMTPQDVRNLSESLSFPGKVGLTGVSPGKSTAQFVEPLVLDASNKAHRVKMSKAQMMDILAKSYDPTTYNMVVDGRVAVVVANEAALREMEKTIPADEMEVKILPDGQLLVSYQQRVPLRLAATEDSGVAQEFFVNRETLEQMMSSLTDQERKLLYAMVQYINNPERRARIKAWSERYLYRDISVQHTYWPRKRARQSEVERSELAGNLFGRDSLEQAGVVKERESWSQDPILVEDALLGFANNVRTIATVLHGTEPISKFRESLESPEVRRALGDTRDGVLIAQRISRTIDMFVREGLGLSHDPTGTNSDMTSSFFRIRRNVTRGLLALNPVVAAFQPLSMLNALTEIDYKWIRMSMMRGYAFSDQIENMLWNIPLLRDRLEKIGLGVVSEGAQEGRQNMYGATDFESAGFTMTAGMDKAAIKVLLGAAYLRAQNEVRNRTGRAAEQGFTKQELMEIRIATESHIIDIVNNTQPTHDVSTMSGIAVQARQNPILALLTMFKTQPFKNWDNMLRQYWMARQEGGSTIGHAGLRKAWIGMVLSTVLLNFMRELWQSLLGENRGKGIEGVAQDMARRNVQTLAGQMPLVGDVLGKGMTQIGDYLSEAVAGGRPFGTREMGYGNTTTDALASTNPWTSTWHNLGDAFVGMVEDVEGIVGSAPAPKAIEFYENSSDFIVSLGILRGHPLTTVIREPSRALVGWTKSTNNGRKPSGKSLKLYNSTLNFD